MSIVRRLVIVPIRLYQRIFSRTSQGHCRYYPSCSEYACQSILKLGLAKGFILSSARILRCSPLFSGGYDPVLPKLKWSWLGKKMWRDMRKYR